MSNNINEVCKRLNGVAGDLSMSRDRETTAFAKDILALLANHDRMQARVSELEAAPATAGGGSEDAHVLGIIADKIEDGKLDHPGIYSNKALAGIVRKASNRALLAMTDGSKNSNLPHVDDINVVESSTTNVRRCVGSEVQP